ncbi:MAG TPA: hypothetical protein O0X25_03135 [Methanocorpusculum sp.]|nr:hypothetical protein [Methanocorpusculum sp.]HJJ40203.1 hypothetical protein [Methanocorpusculum sp.]HJJ49592.1 hypothetical protein [Methanocorpusculum sp.]HJJ57677.1 hypothetical protein [Methanocorpusculum sp.]
MTKDSLSIARPVAIIALIAVVAIMIIPAFTVDFGNPVETATDDYYIDNTEVETGSANAVTAIVFDYRGFDTLGEATVLFVAVLGLIMLFRRAK